MDYNKLNRGNTTNIIPQINCRDCAGIKSLSNCCKDLTDGIIKIKDELCYALKEITELKEVLKKCDPLEYDGEYATCRICGANSYINSDDGFGVHHRYDCIFKELEEGR